MERKPFRRQYSVVSQASAGSRRKQATPKRYGAKPPSNKAALRATVRSEIIRAAEKKKFIFYGANQSLINAGGLTPSGQYMLPQISQGVTDATRIGNRIKVVSGTIKGHVNILPYNVTTNAGPPPLWVKVFLVQYINTNSVNALSATNASTDFFAANGTNVGFQGNMLDVMLPINDDSWKLLESRLFKIGVTNALATGAPSTGAYLDNSDMSKSFEFDVGKYIGSLNYNDQSSTTPTNKNLFMCFQAVCADGSTSNTTPAEYHFSMELRFIDL